MSYAPPQMAQVQAEFDELVRLAQAEGVRSYLEVGSQYGGSLWRMACALPPASRVVSVDMPQGIGPHDQRPTAVSLLACVSELKVRGYDVSCVLGSSTDEATLTMARALGPFDLVFIDANHTLPFVTRDWLNYGPMGRIVAFHDIVWDRPTRPGRLPIEVSKLWRTIETEGRYRTRRIVAEGSEKGIGVVWR